MVVRLIGAGAVGCSVMNRIKDFSDFALIVDSERKKRYEAGLIYNGAKLDVRMLTRDEAYQKADLIIYATKNFHLLDAIEESTPFVGDNTVILPLLNGIDSERVLSEAFGKDKVLYGFITDLSSNHSGLETTCFHDGTIIFGEYDNSRSERVKRICELFDKAGQRYTVAEDILHEKWWKFMVNTCYNTLSGILIADYASMQGNDAFLRAVRMVAKEVQAVASSEGIALGQADVEEMIRRFSRLRDHGQTSMLQDVLAHRETENRYFAGAVARLGRINGVDTPYCEFIQTLLEAKRYVHNS